MSSKKGRSGSVGQSIYQDWWEHTKNVRDGSQSRFHAAMGYFSPHLHNMSLGHDVGKLKDQIQKWYRAYCEKAYPLILYPLEVHAAHTFYKQWTEEHKKLEQEVTNAVGHRPGHQLEGAAANMVKGFLETAMCILGHHGGLPDFRSSQNLNIKTLKRRFLKHDEIENLTEDEFQERFKEKYTEALKESALLYSKASILYSEFQLMECQPLEKSAESDFLMRIMFSCLVDADWADTERWMSTQDNSFIDPPVPPLSNYYDRLSNIDDFVKKQREEFDKEEPGKKPNKNIRSMRDSVYTACLKAAAEPTGIFTLCAPPGGAKTVGSFAFALKHAKKHKLRRIIYVVPYLNILEQNTQLIREMLGLSGEDLSEADQLVIYEHHSIADPIQVGDDHRSRTATALRIRMNNWSCPVIITTNVQFFDSLFSNMPGKCRKLHNIANSVVIFDECHNINPSLTEPTCQMLKQYVQHCNTSFLLCTATQPQWNKKQKGFIHCLKAHSIIRYPGELFKRATRVNATWPTPYSDDNKWTYHELSDRMISMIQAAAIVDTRKKARDLFDILITKVLADCVFHLSTSMCPMHRAAVNARMQECLSLGRLCYLAATPILETGMNISFPVFFRESGPFELIVQAGGRVNRHGEYGSAFIHIFDLLDENRNCISDRVHCPPNEWYKAGRDVIRQIIAAEGPLDINRPDHLESYFRDLYPRKSLDKNNICQAREFWDFYSIAHGPQSYRTIEDQCRSVVCSDWNQKFGEVCIKWDAVNKKITQNTMMLKWFDNARIMRPSDDETMSSIIKTVHEAIRKRPNRWLLTLISYFSANVFWRNFQEFQEEGRIEQDPETEIDFWNGEYDHDKGLIY